MHKDITGTDIESQNQEAKVAADDVLPVQIERRFNNLSTVSVHNPWTGFFSIHLSRH
jgi:hypothetical protein